MSDLVQIVYVSRSTFVPMPPERGIEPSVARILAQSRLNNARRGLVGALYFGDGCFLQCLEGHEDEVDALYERLRRDPRHTDLRLLSRRPIAHASFPAWSMKYVPLDAAVAALMRQVGLSRFDPYAFDEATVARVLALMREGADVDGRPATPAAPHPDVARALRLARWSIATAVAALAGAATAIALAT